MLADITNTLTRARAAAADAEGRRGLFAFARYAVVALVALSILPASAAQLSHAAQESAAPQGEAESNQRQEQPCAAAPEGPTQESVRTQARGDGVALRKFERARAADVVVVCRNMTASASGKHLALRLEMSRAAAGNLLLQKITPN